MPRDPSGNYTLPALGNPAVTNTPITIAWWNGTSTDMASAFTDSLSRSGLGGMLVPFTLVDGSAGAPAFSFQSETNTGLYRAAPGEMDVSVGGTRFSRWTSSGFQESFDNGATWKSPLYNNHGSQSFVGGLDFTAGQLTIGGTAVTIHPTVTRSTSCGTFTTTSASYVAVTNLSLTFTATSGPVAVQLVADDGGTPSRISAAFGGGSPTSYEIVLALSIDNGSTFFAEQTFGYFRGFVDPDVRITTCFPPSAYSAMFAPSPGSITLKVFAKMIATGGTGTGTVLNAELCITQF